MSPQLITILTPSAVATIATSVNLAIRPRSATTLGRPLASFANSSDIERNASRRNPRGYARVTMCALPVLAPLCANPVAASQRRVMTVPAPRSPWVPAARGVHLVGAVLTDALMPAQAAMLTGNRFRNGQLASTRGRDVHN